MTNLRSPVFTKNGFSLRGTTLCDHCGEKSRESRIVSRKIKHQNQTNLGSPVLTKNGFLCGAPPSAPTAVRRS
ncbi:MAG: hypothetical protein KK926_01490 [Methanomethylovorans sp.]|nr:hypothetical protein [Methanomethylovorans sp.]